MLEYMYIEYILTYTCSIYMPQTGTGVAYAMRAACLPESLGTVVERTY